MDYRIAKLYHDMSWLTASFLSSHLFVYVFWTTPACGEFAFEEIIKVVP